MNKFVKISHDDWFDLYKPIVNNIDTNSSFDGYMFETYGAEVEFVKKTNPTHIWTYGDGDDGGSYIWNGWSFVNRIGYFVTEVPCPIDKDVQIEVSEPDLTCDFCGDIEESYENV